MAMGNGKRQKQDEFNPMHFLYLLPYQCLLEGQEDPAPVVLQRLVKLEL